VPNLAVPIPYTWQVGDIANAALLNAQIRDGLTFALNPPLFLGNATSSQSIANNTWTSINVPSLLADTYAGFSNSSRYNAQVTGWYTVCGAVAWTVNSTSGRGAQIYRNNAPLLGHGSFVQAASGTTTSSVTPTRDVFLNAGEYVELFAYQNSGGAVGTVVNSDQASSLYCRWSHA
jgi:hypothetical protein